MIDEKIIKYNDILLLIKNELIETMEEKYEYYKNYEIVVAPEQEFIKIGNINPNAIYIVISFGVTEVAFGQISLPISIRAMSEQNKLEVCQNLLTEFALKYNMSYDDEGIIYQLLDTPSVSTNYNIVHEGFRSLLTMSGTFLVSKDINPVEIYYYNEETKEKEKIDFISFSDSFANSLDTQPFTNNINYNFAQSMAKFGTYSFSLVMFLKNNNFINKILQVRYIDIQNAPDGVDTKFKLDIKHKNSTEAMFIGFKDVNFRLSGSAITQTFNKQPTLSVAFSM